MIHITNIRFHRQWIGLRLSIAVLALSTASIFIRSCNAPSLVIAAYRLTTSFACVLPLSILKPSRTAVRNIPPVTISLIGLSALFLSLHFWLWITSVESTSVTKSTVLVTTSPIFVTIIDWVLLKKQPNRSILIAICLAITGTIVLVHDGSVFQRGSQGDILAIIAAACMAGYLITGHEVLKTVSPSMYILAVYGISSTLLIIVALSLHITLTGFDNQTYFLLVLIGLIPQFIGHSLINTLLKHLQPSIIAIAILGEPFGATILAWIFLNEPPTFIAMLGGAIILSSIGIVARSRG